MITDKQISIIACGNLLSGYKYEFSGDFDEIIWNDEREIPITKQQYEAEFDRVKTDEFAKVGLVHPPVLKSNK